MSYQAMSWAVGVRTGNLTLKAVLMALANYADAREATCFPGQERLADELEVSSRTVMRAMEKLEEMGLIRRVRRFRPDGTRTTDLIALCIREAQPSDKMSGGDQVTVSGGDQVTKTARPSDKACHSRTVIEPSDIPHGTRARGSRVSEGFRPNETCLDLAEKLGLAEDVSNITAQFIDHWLSKSGQDAVKLDWQAAYRTWLRNEVKFNPRRTTNGKAVSQADRTQRGHQAGQPSQRARNFEILDAILAETRKREREAGEGHQGFQEADDGSPRLREGRAA